MSEQCAAQLFRQLRDIRWRTPWLVPLGDRSEETEAVAAIEAAFAAVREEDDLPRHTAQAQAISLLLREAGIGPCTLPEGVRLLLLRAEQAEAALDAQRDRADRFQRLIEEAQAAIEAAGLKEGKHTLASAIEALVAVRDYWRQDSERNMHNAICHQADREQAEAERDALEANERRDYAYLCRLLLAHAPDCIPLDTLEQVITQIDCLLMGYKQAETDPKAAREEKAREGLKRATDGLRAVATLIAESYGVAGLHLNGDVAPWEELRTGGRFEEWLRDFDAALAGGPR